MTCDECGEKLIEMSPFQTGRCETPVIAEREFFGVEILGEAGTLVAGLNRIKSDCCKTAGRDLSGLQMPDSLRKPRFFRAILSDRAPSG